MDVEVAQVRSQGEPDPCLREVGGELPGGPSGVGAHQHRHPPRLVRAAQRGGQLRQRRVEHRDVISGGVGARLAGAQQLGDRLTTAAGTMIGEPEQRVMTKTLLPGRGGVFLLRVRGQQGGVQVDHDLPVLGRRPRPVPHPLPRHRPRTSDRPQRTVGILGQGRDQPRHRRIRGHQPEHPRAAPAARPHHRPRPHPTRPRPRDPPRSCPDHGSRRGAATAPTRPTAPWSAHCAARSPPAAPHPRATPTTHHRRSLTTTACAVYPSLARCLSTRSDQGLCNSDPTVLSRHLRVSGPGVSPTRSILVKARG